MTAALRLGVVSDLHFTETPPADLAWHNPFDVAGVLGRLRAALEWFRDERVEALALDGDLTHRGDPAAFAAVLGVVAECWPGPVFAVPGNHDVLMGDDALADALAQLGEPRIAQATPGGTLVGGVRVAGVDPRSARPADAVRAWGEEPVVLLSHWPLLTRAEAFALEGFRYPADVPGHERWAEALLARRAPTVVVNGHVHARDAQRSGGVLQLSVAALVEPPYEATIVEVGVTDGVATVRRRARALGVSAVERLPLLAPADASFAVSA